eukprot:gene14158-14277_t
MTNLLPIWTLSEAVTDDGARIRYKVTGSGRADLLFVHGWASTRDYFDLVAAALDPAPFRLIAIDLRGHGQSEKGHRGFAAERHARDILAVADAAGAQSFVTIGHSMGAKYSECVPALAPGRVAGQILVAGAPAHVIPISDAELAEWTDLAGMAEELYQSHGTTMSQPVAEPVRRAWAAAAAQIDAEVLRETLRICFRTDAGESAAASANRPVRIVAGANDPFFPPPMLADYAARKFGIAAPDLLDCGHEIPLERPHDVARIISDFCAALQG